MIVAVSLSCLLLAPGAAPGEGQAYLTVGQRELRAGRWKIALLALRRAATLLPRSPEAAAALGTTLARLGELPRAEEELTRALGLGPRRPAWLLELGVVRVRRGRYSAAQRVLEEALRRGRSRALRRAARFYRALAALRLGDRKSARTELRRLAKGGGNLAAGARRMLEIARERPRLSAHLALGGIYDTNPLLLPGTPSPFPLPSPEEDGAFSVITELRGRPLAALDLELHAAFFYRKQHTVDELDLLGASSGIGYRWRTGPHRVRARYDFDYLRLRGDPYLQAHRIGGRYARRLREGLRITADLQMTVRRFAALNFRPFDGEGILSRLTVNLWGAPSPWGLSVGYEPSLELAREEALGFHGHRLFVAATWTPSHRWRLAWGASLALRFYLAADDALEATRHEVAPLVWTTISFRPLHPWQLILSASYEHNRADPTFYAYHRVQVSLVSALTFDIL